MKRMTALFLAVLIILSLAACGKAAVTREKAPEATRQALQQLPPTVSDPSVEMQAVASLKKLNKACGAKFATPEHWAVENELFETATLDGEKIGQYVFTVNGVSCALRFSPDIYKDVSDTEGFNSNSVFDGVKGDVAFAGDCILGRWNTTAGQYILYAATQDIIAFSDLFEALKAAIPG